MKKFTIMMPFYTAYDTTTKKIEQLNKIQTFLNSKEIVFYESYPFYFKGDYKGVFIEEETILYTNIVGFIESEEIQVKDIVEFLERVEGFDYGELYVETGEELIRINTK